MARERMITRTIVTNMFSVIAVNLDAMSVETLHVPAPVDVDTCEKADKFFRKSWSISGYSYAKAIDVERIEKLFGMPESDFMRYAKELPPRTIEQ